MELSISSQNVNTLSLSQGCDDNLRTKLILLLSQGHDIIFLQDLRAKTDMKPCNIDKVKNICLNNPFSAYEAYLNSGSRCRGVAILIKKSINLTVNNIINDTNCNYIIIEGSINNQQVLFLASMVRTVTTAVLHPPSKDSLRLFQRKKTETLI